MMKEPQKKWLQKIKIKKGALSRDLNIPESKNIPIGLLKKIKHSKVGTIIVNPTKTGKEKIKVTDTLKKRANFALILKSFKKKKKK